LYSKPILLFSWTPWLQLNETAKPLDFCMLQGNSKMLANGKLGADSGSCYSDIYQNRKLKIQHWMKLCENKNWTSNELIPVTVLSMQLSVLR